MFACGTSRTEGREPGREGADEGGPGAQFAPDPTGRVGEMGEGRRRQGLSGGEDWGGSP